MQVLEIVDTWVLGRIGRRDREIHLDLAWKLIWWGRPIFFYFSGPKDFADDGIAFAFLLFDRLGDFFSRLGVLQRQHHFRIFAPVMQKLRPVFSEHLAMKTNKLHITFATNLPSGCS